MPTNSPFFNGEGTSARTSDIIIALMKDGTEWSPAALRRHMISHGVRKTYKAVHNALCRLVKSGKVVRVRRGWYRINTPQPTHGVGKPSSGSSMLVTQVTSKTLDNATNRLPATSWTSNFGAPDLPRVHDIWLVADRLPPWVKIKSAKRTLRIGHTEIQITLGAKRRKATVVIENNDGLDYDGFSAIMEIVRRELISLIGWWDSSLFSVKNIHFNIDVVGLRLDGLKSLTLTAFDDWFARIYQKTEEKARLEVGRNDVSVAQVAAILQGGFTGAQALTYIASLHSQFSEVARNLQFLLEQQKQFLRFQQAVLSKLGG